MHIAAKQMECVYVDFFGNMADLSLKALVLVGEFLGEHVEIPPPPSFPVCLLGFLAGSVQLPIPGKYALVSFPGSL